ncbi:hypothetical protein G7013_07550 [Pseudomonas viridiflava]|uniref:hypothetical protein n=1 Tax=Pseudomonas viridiflava TaxID=33069 RepID=UPI0015E2F858|nr:hypothetical protein [Pseudomonas viridiflava]MBA1229500.1 hypothetical protein [Pseudomonas viridiflava]
MAAARLIDLRAALLTEIETHLEWPQHIPTLTYRCQPALDKRTEWLDCAQRLRQVVGRYLLKANPTGGLVLKTGCAGTSGRSKMHSKQAKALPWPSVFHEHFKTALTKTIGK